MDTATVAAAVAKELARAGSTHMFGVPGGGNNLEIVGAAEQAGIEFVLAHTETAAAIMAATFGDLTGKPTACVVTRGPGAASTVNGAAQALLDRQQLILLTDTVSMESASRISHQQLDQAAIFAPVTKATGVVGSEAPGEVTRRAIEVSSASPAGPVHLDFDPTASSRLDVVLPCENPQAPTEFDRRRLDEMLKASRRPAVILGVAARGVACELRSVLSDTAIPVLCTYRAKGVIPESGPNFAGLMTGANIEAPILHAADLILMIGLDTVELIPSEWPYAAPVVAINEWAEKSSYYSPQLELVGPLPGLVEHLAGSLSDTWPQDFASSHKQHTLDQLLPKAGDHAGVSPQDVVQRTRCAAPASAIATVDAGAHMLAAMPLWETDLLDGALISSGLATMGFAIPAAIAAAMAHPASRVICFVGDGGLGMTLAELETIARQKLNISIIVFNDSALSLIAIKAKPEGHGVPNAVSYRDISFSGVAEAMGITARRAEDGVELSSILTQLMQLSGPSLIDVQVDPSGYPDLIEAIRGRRA